MLTLFTIPRSFTGDTGIIQDNAIGSWSRLGPGCETILFGDDPGVAEAATRHGARHVPGVLRNSVGTPLLGDVFARADAIASHSILCFVNADIVLFGDILVAIGRLSGDFLMVSSRFNCRITGPLAFGPGWDHDLRARALAEARMYPAGGSDIFAYRRGLFGAVPPFAIGRGYWDNWLMLHARQRGARLVDATPVIVALHQEHDYAHIPGITAQAKDGPFPTQSTREIEQNLILAGGSARLHTVYDATDVLTTDGRLVSTLHPSLIRRRAKAWLRRAAARLPAPVRTLWNHLRRPGSSET